MILVVFAAFSGARPTGVEQTTVAEAQARANVVEATKELAMIKGTSFTPAQELEAQKQFSQVIARAGTGDLTARETQILTDTGIFEKQIQPQVVPKVSFAGSQLRKDMGFGGQASDVFKTSTRAPVITRTKLTREGLPPGVTGIYPEQTNIEKIKSQLSKLRLYGREKSREGWEGLAGVTPLIAETGKRTAQMIIPRDITSTPERGTKFTFKSETAAEPAGLPKEEYTPPETLMEKWEKV